MEENSNKGKRFFDEVNLMGGVVSVTYYRASDEKQYIDLKCEMSGSVTLNRVETKHLVMFLKRIGWV